MWRALFLTLLLPVGLSCTPRPVAPSQPGTVSIPNPPPEPRTSSDVAPASSEAPPARSPEPGGEAPRCEDTHDDAPAPPPLVSKRPVPAPKGGRKPEDIQAVIRNQYEPFRRCYEAALARNPNAKGNVTMRLVIERDGSVSDVCVKKVTLPDKAAVRCIFDAYRGLRFAPAEVETTVVYPIEFSQG